MPVGEDGKRKKRRKQTARERGRTARENSVLIVRSERGAKQNTGEVLKREARHVKPLCEFVAKHALELSRRIGKPHSKADGGIIQPDIMGPDGIF